MRFWHSEFVHAYDTYTFGYGAYATLEKGDGSEALYALGYLPYSGTADGIDTFYMARSARVDLTQFTPSSENRRILKRFDDTFTIEEISAEEALSDPKLIQFCVEYFATRHGETIMPEERLQLILKHRVAPRVLLYKNGEELKGCVFFVASNSAFHFWYSFYDPALINQSLGMWLMLDCVRRTKEGGMKDFYVGTVYGERALYKTNLEPLSWWDGKEWRTDINTLKQLGRSDLERRVAGVDLWKKATQS